MSERIKWIEVNDRKVLFVDYSNLKGKKMVDVVEEANETVLNSGLKKIYGINDITNSYIIEDCRTKFMQIISNAKKSGIELISAIIGLNDKDKMMAQVFIEDIYFAKDFDDAKNWIEEHD